MFLIIVIRPKSWEQTPMYEEIQIRLINIENTRQTQT